MNTKGLLNRWDCRIDKLEQNAREMRHTGNITRAAFLEGLAAGYSRAYRDVETFNAKKYECQVVSRNALRREGRSEQPK